jgi:uncharacterized repeat protein (TIGR04076 family)
LSVIEVTVKSQKGKCNFGYRVGDQIIFDGKTVRGNTCYAALMILLPYIYALRYGVEFPWAKHGNMLTVACPDAENPVVFEIHRVEK